MSELSLLVHVNKLANHKIKVPTLTVLPVSAMTGMFVALALQNSEV